MLYTYVSLVSISEKYPIWAGLTIPSSILTDDQIKSTGKERKNPAFEKKKKDKRQKIQYGGN